MAGHVVSTLLGVRKVGCPFGNQPLQEFFKITARRRVGVFEKEQAGAGVLDKNIDQTRLYLAGTDYFSHSISDFISAFACSPEHEFGIVSDEHKRRGKEKDTPQHCLNPFNCGLLTTAAFPGQRELGPILTPDS